MTPNKGSTGHLLPIETGQRLSAIDSAVKLSGCGMRWLFGSQWSHRAPMAPATWRSPACDDWPGRLSQKLEPGVCRKASSSLLDERPSAALRWGIDQSGRSHRGGGWRSDAELIGADPGQGGAKHSLKRSGSAEPVALMRHKALHFYYMQVRHLINAECRPCPRIQ